MFKFLKKIFCKHNFIDKCKVKTYNNTNWQDLCSSRIKNKHCKIHNDKGQLLGGYCDYFYQECSKCGKIKNRLELRGE